MRQIYISTLLLTVLLSFVIVRSSSGINLKNAGETFATKHNTTKNVNPTWDVNMEGQQALNVVFFIPSDFPSDQKTIADRTENISELMLYIQAWYKKQMAHTGFGEKTFGLLTNNEGQVLVNVIKSPHPSTYFGGNSNKVSQEVEEFFRKNPELKSSVHTLVLGDFGCKIGFQGIAPWCFATSEDFKLTDTGLKFDGFELKNCKRLGGIMHELGHGLNLPHNCQKASQVPDVPLMSNGNRVYINAPDKVFLTQSSCAILSTNVVFNKTTNGINYYNEMPKTVIKTLAIAKNDSLQTIDISGTFSSSVNIPYVYLGFDFVNENASPPNDNYDEITYLTEPLKKDNNQYEFNIRVGYTDLFNGFQDKIKDKTVIELNLISENGFRLVPYSHYYTTDLSSRVPNNDLLINYSAFALSDRSGWAITANSIPENKADIYVDMIDSNENTFWHSHWPYSIAKNGPHEIDIDMKHTKTVNGVYILSTRPGAQFRPKHVKVLTSTNNTDWVEAGTISIASIENAERFTIDFTKSVEARYLKILVDEIFKNSKSPAENLVITEIDTF
ncbi:MAG: discoidin domain-containing protein [Draconibacterium sp.]